MDSLHLFDMIGRFRCESYLAMADIPVFHHFLLEILYSKILCSHKRQYPLLIPFFWPLTDTFLLASCLET